MATINYNKNFYKKLIIKNLPEIASQAKTYFKVLGQPIITLNPISNQIDYSFILIFMKSIYALGNIYFFMGKQNFFNRHNKFNNLVGPSVIIVNQGCINLSYIKITESA